jgi:hypothetical protein
MIKIRLDKMVNIISEVFYSSGSDFYFGTRRGWGNIESGFLDLLLNTGVIGFLSCLFTFTFLIYLISQKLNFSILKKNINYILFSFFTLFFSNIVNNSISTPYYFISFFMIFLIALNEKPAVTEN